MRIDQRKAALAIIAVVVILCLGTMIGMSAAAYRKSGPGRIVSPTVYDSGDGNYYYARGASGTYGVAYMQTFHFGTDEWATGTHTASAIELAPADPNRAELWIWNLRHPYSSDSVWIGADNTVTDPLGANWGGEITRGDVMSTHTTDAVFGYCAATCTYLIWEVK